VVITERQTTLNDVASRAGVSPATVSRVLNGNYPVATSTRDRVLEAVRHYDYVLNVHARALIHAQSGIIGIVLADVSDPFFSEVARGVQSVAAQADLLAVICNTGGDPDQELKYINLLRTHRADAVILVGAGSEHPRIQGELVRHAEGLARQGSLLVFCGRPLPGATAAAGVVEVDNHGATELAMIHLARLGHRRILYLAGPPSNTTTTARLAGVLAAAKKRRIARRDLTVRSGDLSRRSGQELVEGALHEGIDFTAVLASNDLMAIGALVALRKAGISVPERVSVIGIDDVPIAADVTPTLTTVHLPLEEMGAAAAELAVQERVAGTRLAPPVRLVERESAAPAP
jgi:LacI family transcriptional regulator